MKGSESQDDDLRQSSQSNTFRCTVEGRTKQLILFGVRGAIAARGGDFRVTALGGPGERSSIEHPLFSARVGILRNTETKAGTNVKRA